jgi:hypothetical protein
MPEGVTMFNRINQLVLNIRQEANQARKHGFVTVAGTKLASVHLTAVPSVGRPMSSPPVSDVYPIMRDDMDLRRTWPSTATLAFLGNRDGLGGWNGSRVQRSPVCRHTIRSYSGHESMKHRDYPSNDVFHAFGISSDVSISTFGK